VIVYGNVESERAMTNDLADQLDDIALAATEAASDLRSRAPAPRDWLAEYVAGEGDVINTDEAAQIIDCHRDTARSRAEKAMEAGKPIAVLVAGAAWLFSQARLLDSIEISDGRHGRLAAETRAAEMRKLRHKTKLTAPIRIETEPPSSNKRATGIS
jgi:hypothetical protein